MPAQPNQDLYISDTHETDRMKDRFNRWPFAQRVAQTIARRQDPSSLVVGIYGSWGEGKTTVFSYIEQELNNHQNVICIPFNPWRYGDEVQLLRQFFAHLAASLKKSISSKGEKIGQAISEYGDAISSTLDILGGLGGLGGLGKAVTNVADKVANVDLEILKARVEKILRDAGKRVVILMDDIDRLDRSEIQAVFRLIKLSADFSYITYIVAFDEEVVASAIGEKYGDGGKESGRKFLEKIISVPLLLPRADQAALRKFCLANVTESLKVAGIELTEGQRRLFVETFDSSLITRLQTPRMIKRYSNALVFALPILKGEVNPLDLMLLEALRLCFPQAYAVVRDNPDIFVSWPSFFNRDELAERNRQVVNQALSGYTIREIEAAKLIIVTLFPSLNQVLEVTRYSAIGQDQIGEQRIASPYYFDRYFAYSVLEGDISDQDFTVFLATVSTQPLSDVPTLIQNIVTSHTVENILLKLRREERSVLLDVAEKLAIGVAQISELFGVSDPNGFFQSPFTDVATYVSSLIRRIAAGQKRFDIASTVIAQAQSVLFLSEWFRWMQGQDSNGVFAFDDDDMQTLGRQVATRIATVELDEPIYVKWPEYAVRLLYLWSRWGSKEETGQYIAQTLQENPQHAIALIRLYLPSIIVLGYDDRGDYAALTAIADADIIYQALYQLYGNVLESSLFTDAGGALDIHNTDHPFRHLSQDEQLAHVFAYMYHKPHQEGEDETNNDS
ncbi:MAG TPA: P-loop NTPase fold protein [Herpetosiphonaceae bacterium]